MIISSRVILNKARHGTRATFTGPRVKDLDLEQGFTTISNEVMANSSSLVFELWLETSHKSFGGADRYRSWQNIALAAKFILSRGHPDSLKWMSMPIWLFSWAWKLNLHSGWHWTGPYNNDCLLLNHAILREENRYIQNQFRPEPMLSEVSLLTKCAYWLRNIFPRGILTGLSRKEKD